MIILLQEKMKTVKFFQNIVKPGYKIPKPPAHLSSFGGSHQFLVKNAHR